jgi:hypothetical protein
MDGNGIGGKMEDLGGCLGNELAEETAFEGVIYVNMVLLNIFIAVSVTCFVKIHAHEAV